MRADEPMGDRDGRRGVERPRAAACGGGDGGYRHRDPGGGLTGSITISGSSTVEPISSLVAELFNETNPDVAISVDGPGTGDGFELFCSGETDISDASRPIDEEEVAACEDNGIEYSELEVAFDGITVMTNPANAGRLPHDRGSLRAVRSRVGGVIDWNDAELARGRGRAAPATSPTHRSRSPRPGEESGTYDAFIELSGIPDLAIERGLAEAEASGLRKDYRASAERQRDPPGDRRVTVRDRLRRVRLRRRGRRSGEGDPGRRGRWMRRTRRRRRSPTPRTPVPIAVHLRQHREGRGERGPESVRRLLPDRRGPHRRGRGGRVRPAAGRTGSTRRGAAWKEGPRSSRHPCQPLRPRRRCAGTRVVAGRSGAMRALFRTRGAGCPSRSASRSSSR